MFEVEKVVFVQKLSYNNENKTDQIEFLNRSSQRRCLLVAVGDGGGGGGVVASVALCEQEHAPRTVATVQFL